MNPGATFQVDPGFFKLNSTYQKAAGAAAKPDAFRRIQIPVSHCLKRTRRCVFSQQSFYFNAH